MKSRNFVFRTLERRNYYWCCDVTSLPYQGEIRLTRLEKIFRYTGFKT